LCACVGGGGGEHLLKVLYVRGGIKCGKFPDQLTLSGSDKELSVANLPVFLYLLPYLVCL
jgi:hypothetical protein